MRIERTTVLEPLVSSTARVGAEEVEYFEVLDEHGRGTGRRELRAVVHATGLFHRAVYCFVFDTAGRLLIQRRHADKKVGPEQWDLSVAEHLTPGEGYAAAVVRGLQEELGIEVPRDAIKGPLTPAHKRSLKLPNIGVTDNEYVESYRLDGYDGPVKFNSAEVTEVKFVALDEVQEQMAERPADFTQWFKDELSVVRPLLNSAQIDPAAN